MKDKHDFLEKLRSALLEREISETDINPYLERFDRFYDRMVNDPETDRSDILADVDSIADNIAAQVSERYDEINRLAERTMTVERIDADKDSTDYIDLEAAGSGEPAAQPEAAENKIQAKASETVPTEPEKRLPDYIDEESSPNSTVFWIIFGVSLPVTIPLAAASLFIFVAVWGGLAALILSSIAALIVTAAGGTALSLVGIIYGVTKLFDSVPVGLYEIGLGVLIGGGVMFSGILLYNFAVRLLPLVIKLVARLFRYLFARLKVLFGFLRRECAKL